MTKEEFDKLYEEYDSYGFMRYIDGLDAEAASEYPCEECGGKNVYGTGLKKGKEYHAFAVCPDCGHVIEF